MKVPIFPVECDEGLSHSRTNSRVTEHTGGNGYFDSKSRYVPGNAGTGSLGWVLNAWRSSNEHFSLIIFPWLSDARDRGVGSFCHGQPVDSVIVCASFNTATMETVFQSALNPYLKATLLAGFGGYTGIVRNLPHQLKLHRNLEPIVVNCPVSLVVLYTARS